MYKLGLSLGGLLDSIYHICNLFGNLPWAFPCSLQFRASAFLALRIVQPHLFPLSIGIHSRSLVIIALSSGEREEICSHLGRLRPDSNQRITGDEMGLLRCFFCSSSLVIPFFSPQGPQEKTMDSMTVQQCLWPTFFLFLPLSFPSSVRDISPVLVS